MSSPDPARRAFLAGGLVLAAAALGGCQVRPLYADPRNPMIPGNRGEMAAIELNSPKNRVEQTFANELRFQLTGGGDPAEPRYRLRYLVNETSDPLAIERAENLPGAVLLTLNATFILTDLADGRTLLTGSTFATASYDFSSQRFANVRAKRDAENRAAVAIARNVAIRLAAYFAARA